MKNTLTILGIVIVIAGGGLFLFMNNSDSPDTTDMEMEGEEKVETKAGGDKESLEVLYEVPAFSLVGYDGNTVTEKDFTGKSLIINSWASWCPFCVDELPDFVTIQNEYKEDVVFIAINRRESEEKAKDFTDKLGLSDDLVYLLDPGDSFYTSIGGFTMPETIFVDPSGNVRIHKRGVIDLDETRELVISLIESSGS